MMDIHNRRWLEKIAMLCLFLVTSWIMVISDYISLPVISPAFKLVGHTSDQSSVPDISPTFKLADHITATVTDKPSAWVTNANTTSANNMIHTATNHSQQSSPELEAIHQRVKALLTFLEPYVNTLTSIRTQLMQTIDWNKTMSPENFNISQSQTMVHMRQDDFFEQLNIHQNSSSFRVLKIETDLVTARRLFTYKFKSVANEGLYNLTLNIYHSYTPLFTTNTTSSFSSGEEYNVQDFETGVPHQYRLDEKSLLLAFILVLPYALIAPYGEVYHSGYVINPGGCMKSFTQPLYENSTAYDEVFTVSQYWGEGFFHAAVEDIPRVAPFLTFLKTHTSIFVHTTTNSSFVLDMLGRLGIVESRIVTGYIRARIVYMPSGTHCGTVSVFKGQLMNAFFLATLTPFPQRERNVMILIRRSYTRYFIRHDEIETSLQQLASKSNLTLKIFDDRHLPSLGDTMTLFAKAVLVVGPHGSGVSNALFSLPGTIFVEGLCEWNVVFCYRNLTYSIGHRYLGMMSETGSCFNFTPQEIITSIQTALPTVSSMLRLT